MITVNIHIEGDGKSISTSSNLKHSQEVLPSPLAQKSNDATGSGVPTPQNDGNFSNNKFSSSIPHPEGFASSLSSSIDQTPGPMTAVIASSPVDTKVPEPMDFEEHGSALPTTKPKTRNTKRKSGSK